MPRPLLLAGDIGGTKCNLGLFEAGEDGLRKVRSEIYASEDQPSLTAVIREFFASAPAEGVRAACFGVPGPVIENCTRTPNLAWEIDGGAVARETGIPVLLLINDLVAAAEGIPLLAPRELATIQEGDPHAGGNRVLIAAGTGLGMGLLPRIDRIWRAVPSEGGHMDFAPRNQEEIGLFLHLLKQFPEHVSVERVVSGPGLYDIYRYLRDRGGLRDEPQMLTELEKEDPDPARVIGETGLAEPDSLCGRALGMFAAAYGAAAGNLALAATATGGVYVGGGIAPKILPRLTDGVFRQAFLEKGRFRSFMEQIPVRVLLNQETALLGAARTAAALLDPSPLPHPL